MHRARVEFAGWLFPLRPSFSASHRFTDEQCLTKRFNMFGRFNLLQNLHNSLIRADNEGRPFRSKIFLAVHAFLHPDMVGVCQRLVRVAQERERKAILPNEFLVAFNRVDAHTKQFSLRLDIGPVIANVARLLSASGSTVFRIEIKDQGRSLKIGQLHRLAGAINASDRNCLKVRGWITNLKFHKRKGSCHAYRSCAIHFTAPCPAMVPVAKQPCSKYPPVGASQSIISPAQNIPGYFFSISSSSSSSQATPPAEDIASSTGRGATSFTSLFLMPASSVEKSVKHFFSSSRAMAAALSRQLFAADSLIDSPSRQRRRSSVGSKSGLRSIVIL